MQAGLIKLPEPGLQPRRHRAPFVEVGRAAPGLTIQFGLNLGKIKRREAAISRNLATGNHQMFDMRGGRTARDEVGGIHVDNDIF